MTVSERRWRWYFELLSPKTRRHLYRLPDEAWRTWESRAATLSHFRQVRGVENLIQPPLQWWEKEAFLSMLALAEETGLGSPVN